MSFEQEATSNVSRRPTRWSAIEDLPERNHPNGISPPLHIDTPATEDQNISSRKRRSSPTPGKTSRGAKGDKNGKSERHTEKSKDKSKSSKKGGKTRKRDHGSPSQHSNDKVADDAGSNNHYDNGRSQHIWSGSHRRSRSRSRKGSAVDEYDSSANSGFVGGGPDDGVSSATERRHSSGPGKSSRRHDRSRSRRRELKRAHKTVGSDRSRTSEREVRSAYQQDDPSSSGSNSRRTRVGSSTNRRSSRDDSRPSNYDGPECKEDARRKNWWEHEPPYVKSLGRGHRGTRGGVMLGGGHGNQQQVPYPGMQIPPHPNDLQGQSNHLPAQLHFYPPISCLQHPQQQQPNAFYGIHTAGANTSTGGQQQSNCPEPLHEPPPYVEQDITRNHNINQPPIGQFGPSPHMAPHSSSAHQMSPLDSRDTSFTGPRNKRNKIEMPSKASPYGSNSHIAMKQMLPMDSNPTARGGADPFLAEDRSRPQGISLQTPHSYRSPSASSRSPIDSRSGSASRAVPVLRPRTNGRRNPMVASPPVTAAILTPRVPSVADEANASSLSTGSSSGVYDPTSGVTGGMGTGGQPPYSHHHRSVPMPSGPFGDQHSLPLPHQHSSSQYMPNQTQQPHVFPQHKHTGTAGNVHQVMPMGPSSARNPPPPPPGMQGTISQRIHQNVPNVTLKVDQQHPQHFSSMNIPVPSDIPRESNYFFSRPLQSAVPSASHFVSPQQPVGVLGMTAPVMPDTPMASGSTPTATAATPTPSYAHVMPPNTQQPFQQQQISTQSSTDPKYHQSHPSSPGQLITAHHNASSESYGDSTAAPLDHSIRAPPTRQPHISAHFSTVGTDQLGSMIPPSKDAQQIGSASAPTAPQQHIGMRPVYDSGEAALPPVAERPPSVPYDEESILMTWLEDEAAASLKRGCLTPDIKSKICWRFAGESLMEDVCGGGSLQLTEKDAMTPRSFEHWQPKKRNTASQRGSLTWEGEVNVNSIAIPSLEGGGVADDAVVSECITYVEGLKAAYCEVVRLGLKLAAT